MLNKLERVKILHLHEHYRLNEQLHLRDGNIETANEYKIRLETIKLILDSFEMKPYEINT